jgi:hypothetical protein
MPTRDLARIIEVLTEIQSDIRSIKSDIKSLLTRSPPVSSGEQSQPFIESIEPPDPNFNAEIIRYLRDKPGNDEIGSD